MSFLPLPQVCVIDDEEAEYLHLLEALKAEGIGWVHVPGDKVETLPPKPLEGFRIVFLDMHLGTDSTKTDREITAHTANVFAHVVAESSSPLAVIVWTKHVNLIESFRQSLFDACPAFKGRLFFVQWEKPVSSSDIDSIQLRDALHAEMNNLDPLALLWGWDALVQRAASGVIAELCKVARTQAELKPEDTEADERGKLLKALTSVLGKLINAEMGKSGTAADASAALQRALDPLLADRIDHISPKPELEGAKPLIENLVAGPAAPEVLTAINSMLLIGSVTESKRPFCPGTLFRVCNLDAFKTAIGISEDDLIRELCQKETSEDATKRSAFFADCHIALLEVSPGCDFAQGKRPVARLLAGLIVPSSRKRELKKSEASRQIPAEVILPSVDKEKSWIPIFTSALVMSWPEKNEATFLEPIGRFKEPLLTDCRNWLAHQAGRVGYMYLAAK